MAPLEIEVYNKQVGRWVKAGEVKPGDRPGSMSDSKADGKRDIYLFECAADDSKSIIYRSAFGADLESAKEERTIFLDPSKRVVIKELVKGESYEMTVTTERARQSSRIRFTHS